MIRWQVTSWRLLKKHLVTVDGKFFFFATHCALENASCQRNAGSNHAQKKKCSSHQNSRRSPVGVPAVRNHVVNCRDQAISTRATFQAQQQLIHRPSCHA